MISRLNLALFLAAFAHSIAFAEPVSSVPPAVENLNVEVKGVGTTGLVPCAPNAARVCQSPTDEDIKKNVQTPFSQKFNVVTKDISSQSAENIKNMEAWIKSARPDFGKYLKQAETQVDQIEKSFEVTHATKAKSAVSILKSGALFSRDELIRRGIISLDQINGISHYDSDGMIGEQDVIFFKLKDPRTRSSASDAFGGVIFHFSAEKKKELLEKGYFTPYAYGFGSPIKRYDPSKCVGDELRPENRAPFDNISLYSSFLFNGQRDYRKWIQLSIAEMLWEKDHLPPSLLNKMKKEVKEHLGGKVGSAAPMKSYSEIYKALDLPFPTQAPESLTWYEREEIAKYFSKDLNSETERIEKVMNSYRGMPRPMGGRTLMGTMNFNWWELKVPEKVELNQIDRIDFWETDPTESENLRKAISSYAIAQNKKVIERPVQKGLVEFKFVNAS